MLDEDYDPSAGERSDGEGDAIMSDSPLVARLEEQCAAIHGDDWDVSLGLEQLLNPATVRGGRLALLTAGLSSNPRHSIFLFVFCLFSFLVSFLFGWFL
jgi:hypothetical protein